MELETTLKAIAIGGGGILMLIGIILIIKNFKGLSSRSLLVSGSFALIMGMIFIATSQFITIPEVEVRTTTEIYTEAVNNGYTVYVDGTEVKPNTINVNDYKMTIDDENRNIQLSTSNDNKAHLLSLMIICLPLMLMFILFKK